MHSVKKIAIAGILLAVAIGLAYPVAVSALSMAMQHINSSNKAATQTQQIQDGEAADGEYLTVLRSWDEEDRGGHRGHAAAVALPKVVLSALVNITSSNVQNVSVKDLAEIVLTKKGGNYSVLLLVKAKSSKHVYHAMIGNVSLSIGSDKISIDGTIKRSTIPGFETNSTIHMDIMIGSATISSGSSQLSGDILGLIFKR